MLCELVPRYDDTYDGTFDVWVEGDAIPSVLAFDPDDGGVTVPDSDLEVIMDVSNSPSFTDQPRLTQFNGLPINNFT